MGPPNCSYTWVITFIDIIPFSFYGCRMWASVYAFANVIHRLQPFREKISVLHLPFTLVNYFIIFIPEIGQTTFPQLMTNYFDGPLYSHSFLGVIENLHQVLLLIPRTATTEMEIAGCNGSCLNAWGSDGHFIKMEEDNGNEKMRSQMSSPSLGAA